MKQTNDNREYLFVYGLFRDAARPLLGKYSICGKASVKGRMYMVNEFYPGWVPGENGLVWGDIYLIDPSVFPELDEFEGPEYDRIKVTTLNDIECWIYKYKFDTSTFKEIKSGDWMLR